MDEQGQMKTTKQPTFNKLYMALLPALLVVGLVVLVTGTVFVTDAAAQGDDAPRLKVITQALNVREGPGVTYPIVGLLTQGDQVPVVGQHAASGWWQVALADGNEGWVSGGSAYVSVSGDTRALPEVPVATPGSSGIEVATPSTSEAGGTIVFQTASGGAIYAVNVDGSNLRYLTTGMDPALSPDGQWVAFTRWEDSQNGALGSLWVIDIDGSGGRQVLGDIHQPRSPTWSPDGAQIAIGTQHGGRVHEERKCGSERPPREAYDVDIDREIESDGEVKVKFCYTLPPHPYYGLQVVDVASGDFEDLPNDLFSLSPTWDPADSGQVVFDGERGLMGLNLEQGSIWQLTKDANDHSPVFSPDGTKIAVSYWQTDHWEIHVMNSDGSGRVRLTETSVRARIEQMINGIMPQSWNNAAPAWSPDGSQIAFLTDRSGQWEIWTMNSDGGNQQPLVTAEMLGGVTLQYNGMEERMLSWQ